MAHYTAPAAIFLPIATKRHHAALDGDVPACRGRFSLAADTQRTAHNQPLFGAGYGDVKQAFMLLKLTLLLHLDNFEQPARLFDFADWQ